MFRNGGRLKNVSFGFSWAEAAGARGVKEVPTSANRAKQNAATNREIRQKLKRENLQVELLFRTKSESSWYNSFSVSTTSRAAKRSRASDRGLAPAGLTTGC